MLVELRTSLATLLLIFLLSCFTPHPPAKVIIQRNTISDFHIGMRLKGVDRKVLICTSDKSIENGDPVCFRVCVDSVAFIWQQHRIPLPWKETWEFCHLKTDMGHCLSSKNSIVITQLTDTSLQFTSPARRKAVSAKICTKDRGPWISWPDLLTFFPPCPNEWHCLWTSTHESPYSNAFS